MELYKNMVYEWTGKPGPHSVERLLWLEQGQDFVWTIRVFDPKAQPVRRVRAELEAALESGEARVLERDPFAGLSRPEEDIEKKHRRRRDAAWQMIAPLVESDDPRIFHFYLRNSPVIAHAKSKGYDKVTLYRHLRRYWQRGQTKNAQTPLFDQCGWRDRLDPKRSKGEGEPEGEAKQHQKLGRPGKISAATGEVRGVNVTKDVLQRFRMGIKMFYETREARTLSAAFQMTLEKFFHCGYYQSRDGVWVAALPPAEDLPTYRQFRYWYKKERNPRRSQTARRGGTRYNLSGRETLGDSTQMAFGPGSIFQIDATIGDVYLVSSLDRNWIIGRPVIYFVVDVFSHMGVGLSVTLEGPSWVGAMLALENATVDKVAFCAEYGITIEESEWPCHHLPEGIMADRGELEGCSADHLVNAFNMRVHNTAPYRGDLKGIVEQHIDLCNEKIIHWTPGRVRKRERGDRDYRLDATLDLHEFRKLMILSALDHNNQHRLDRYRMDEHMIADHVEPYPVELWNWGIQNRSGHLRRLDADTVRLNLLPEAEASVTENGIRFADLCYTCDLAVQEQWFVRAGESGSWKIRVAHDPRTRRRIYLRLDNGKRMETCHLLEADKTFRERDWYETADEFELRRLRSEAARTRKQRSRSEFHASTDQVIGQAKDKTGKARTDVSDKARVTGIRESRKREREAERRANAWHLGEDGPAAQPDEATLKQAVNDSPGGRIAHYVPPPQPTDKLRRIRERRMQK
ncbi:MAG: Mu transposase C-terminal domain-containing protein [Acidobacteriota bacterium]|nr:Mu transposase C-terminal domain-containing protein [Acidobacteriota bacterium]